MSLVGNVIGQLKQTASSLVESDTAADEQSKAEESSSFDELLRQILPVSDNAAEVNEEQLFAALIFERLNSSAGAEVANQFKDLLESKANSFRRSNGNTSYEDAARGALKELAKQGVISVEDADKVHSEAFQAAQLDTNTEALFDSIGGGNDATRAVMSLEDALVAAKGMLDKLLNSSVELTSRPVYTTQSNSVYAPVYSKGVSDTGSQAGLPTEDQTITASGTSIDGENGFLFKPISNNQGRLAVLLPAEMTHQVMQVILRDSSGKEIERGQLISEGIAETGREKYNFSKQGGSYPDNLTVEVLLANGARMNYQIDDPSKRYD